jgi:hypothetical protein
MYIYANDPPLAATVILHRGVSTGAEQARYIETFVAMDKELRQHQAPVWLLVTDGEPPDAVWRKKIAEASRDVSKNVLVAFVSTSALQRGIITAINWLRPPHFRFTVAADVEAAITWVERHRPGTRAALERLHEQARQEADLVRPLPR